MHERSPRSTRDHQVMQVIGRQSRKLRLQPQQNETLRGPDPEDVAHGHAKFDALCDDGFDHQLEGEGRFPDEGFAKCGRRSASVSGPLCAPFAGVLVQGPHATVAKRDCCQYRSGFPQKCRLNFPYFVD